MTQLYFYQFLPTTVCLQLLEGRHCEPNPTNLKFFIKSVYKSQHPLHQFSFLLFWGQFWRRPCPLKTFIYFVKLLVHVLTHFVQCLYRLCVVYLEPDWFAELLAVFQAAFAEFRFEIWAQFIDQNRSLLFALSFGPGRWSWVDPLRCISRIKLILSLLLHTLQLLLEVSPESN